MQKFCCFPCSETPNVDVDVKCISTCCGSQVADSLNQRGMDSVDCTDNAKTNNIDNIDNFTEQGCDSTKCSCFNFLKRRSAKIPTEENKVGGDG